MKRAITILIIMSAFVLTSSAESGSITVSGTQAFSYAMGDPQVAVNWNWSEWIFDRADYSRVSDWRVTSWNPGVRHLDMVNDFESTTFTCTLGCTGTGVAYYYKSTASVYFVFDGNPIITASPFNLSFAKNIFANITSSDGQWSSGHAVGVTEPLAMRSFGGTTAGFQYDTNIVAQTTDQYLVTYFNSGGNTYFTVGITKGGEVTDKYIIQNQTTLTNPLKNYSYETTFNTINKNFTAIYRDGLWLNVSIATGDYTLLLVNSTGVSAPVIGHGGSQNGQMYFDTVQPYFKGYFGINVSMNSATFDSNKRYFIDVFEPSGKEKIGFPIEISSASYTTGRNWVFSDYGLWNATLTDCNQFNFLCGISGFGGLPPSYQQLIDCVNNPLCGTRSHLVDVAIQVINVSEYTYTITSDATIYATNDTIYFNVTSTNPTGAYFTVLDSLGNVVNPLANNVVIGQGVTLYNVTIPTTIQNGNYTAILALNTGYFAQVKAYQFSIGVVPGRDSISWSDNNIFGYTNTLKWSNGVSSVTSLNYITVSKLVNDTLIETDNFTVTNNSISSKSYLMDTVGFWSAALHNTTTGTTKYANMSVFASSVGLCSTKLDDFVCFNNQSYYPGSTYTINYQTKSLPDCFLTGPCIPPYSKIVVKVLNPNSVAVFNKTLVDCTNQGGVVTNSPCHYTKPLLGSAISMFKVSAVPGTYQVLLVLDRRDYRNNSDQVIEDVLASNTAVLISKPITTPTPPTGQQGTTAMGNNLLSFMYVPAFWGVILWFSIVVISASSGAKNAMSNTGVVALAAALLLSIVGLFDPYRWFVLAGLIVIAGIWFMVGRKVTSGDT